MLEKDSPPFTFWTKPTIVSSQFPSKLWSSLAGYGLSEETLAINVPWLSRMKVLLAFLFGIYLNDAINLILFSSWTSSSS